MTARAFPNACNFGTLYFFKVFVTDPELHQTKKAKLEGTFLFTFLQRKLNEIPRSCRSTLHFFSGM